MNSITFIERELENIINVRTSNEYTNALIIVNDKEITKISHEKIANQDYLNHTIIKELGLPIIKINLAIDNLVNIGIEKFLKKVSLKKVKRGIKNVLSDLENTSTRKGFRNKFQSEINLNHFTSCCEIERNSSSVEKYMKNIF